MVSATPWPFAGQGVDFPGRNAGENLQFYFRHHWIRIISAFIRLIVFSVAVFALGYAIFPGAFAGPLTSWHLILVALLLSFFAAQFQFLFKFYCHFVRLVIVTDQCVHRIRKTLVSFDDHDVIDLASLQEVRKIQHGVLQNILGYGTLVLEAQHTVMRIHFTPSIARTHRWIMELRDEARRRTASPSYGNRPTSFPS